MGQVPEINLMMMMMMMLMIMIQKVLFFQILGSDVALSQAIEVDHVRSTLISLCLGRLCFSSPGIIQFQLASSLTGRQTRGVV